MNKMEINMHYEELYPNVDVYRGLLPDAEELYQIMKESEESAEGRYYLRPWTQWSHFGTYAQQKHDPNEPRELGEKYDKEKYLSDRVYEAYNLAINDYLTRHEIELPTGAELMSSSFSKYKKDLDVLENNLAMQYHTDFVLSERDMPGKKFFLTCTTYINDDYDGGDIEFFVNGKFINHKPKAGDILVFPSSLPYFHGVKTIKNGQKYFIRNFIMYETDGSKDWLTKQKYYGALKWAEIEKERLDKEAPYGMLYMIDNKPVSYDEFKKNSR
jgi:hypothetical protein